MSRTGASCQAPMPPEQPSREEPWRDVVVARTVGACYDAAADLRRLSKWRYAHRQKPLRQEAGALVLETLFSSRPRVDPHPTPQCALICVVSIPFKTVWKILRLSPCTFSYHLVGASRYTASRSAEDAATAKRSGFVHSSALISTSCSFNRVGGLCLSKSFIVFMTLPPITKTASPAVAIIALIQAGQMESWLHQAGRGRAQEDYPRPKVPDSHGDWLGSGNNNE